MDDYPSMIESLHGLGDFLLDEIKEWSACMHPHRMDGSTITFRPIDAKHARAIASWRYEAPYDVYNPGVEGVEQSVQYFLDARNSIFSMIDEQGELIGFCSFGPDGQVPGGEYSENALDVGMGMRPDLIGQGRGEKHLGAVLSFGKRMFNPMMFRVTVAAFNRRALRMCQKAGFNPVHSFRKSGTDMDFLILTRPA
jgi:RimJ/RimL family protein N-acetyltransferase